MTFRLLLCCAVSLTLLSGCSNPEKKKADEAAKKREQELGPARIPDVSEDLSYAAFVGRLRQAVAKRDRATLLSMMSPTFGYRWDPAMSGETPFDYWDEHKLWPELEEVLGTKFTPGGDLMVAPPAFANDPKSFTGYRVGIGLSGTAWKFVYFIGGQNPLP